MHPDERPTVSLTPAPADSLVELSVVDPACYRVSDEVARGGIGRILAAFDVRLQREVALKQLHDPSADQTRFVREALLTARLQHPSIVPVHEVGRFPSGEPFIAMKLVRGQSLRDALRARHNLDERLQLLPNVLSVADAIAYAHSQRVIHRDLKPSNVLIGEFGETVVIDWGLAKQLDEPEPRIAATPAAATAAGAPARSSTTTPSSPSGQATEAGTVLGTPAYMAPEQAAGANVDERADVFALGAILYEVVAGAPPFDGASATEVLAHARIGAAPPVESRAAGVPRDLAAVIARAMASRPEDRYRDGRELAADLRRFQLGQVPSSHRNSVERDPAIEAAFTDELRQRTLSPLATACWILVTLVPIYGVVRALISGRAALGEIVPRGIVVALVALVLGSTRTQLGRRYSAELAMFLLALAGALICFLYLRGPESEFAGSTGSMVLVLLGGSTLFHLPPRRMTALLLLISAGFLATSIIFEANPSRARLLVQLSLFGGATVIAIIGIRIQFRVLRAEFYNRYRLEEANRRLAQLERRR